MPEFNVKHAGFETFNPSTHGPAREFTNKDRTDRVPTQLSESTCNTEKAWHWGAGPAREMWRGNENTATSGASMSDGLVNERAPPEQKQKHHFWERKRNKDHTKGPADRGGHKSWSAWPEPGDPLGDGNLGQGFVWR